MVRVAFIGALWASGTQKFLQTVAVYLPKDKYKVDFYYNDKDVAKFRKEYVLKNNVNIFPYHFRNSIMKKGYRVYYKCDLTLLIDKLFLQ